MSTPEVSVSQPFIVVKNKFEIYFYDFVFCIVSGLDLNDNKIISKLIFEGFENYLGTNFRFRMLCSLITVPCSFKNSLEVDIIEGKFSGVLGSPL